MSMIQFYIALIITIAATATAKVTFQKDRRFMNKEPIQVEYVAERPAVHQVADFPIQMK